MVNGDVGGETGAEKGTKNMEGSRGEAGTSRENIGLDGEGTTSYEPLQTGDGKTLCFFEMAYLLEAEPEHDLFQI